MVESSYHERLRYDYLGLTGSSPLCSQNMTKPKVSSLIDLAAIFVSSGLLVDYLYYCRYEKIF